MSNNVIATAEKLVNGDRQNNYGHPYDDFSRTAAMMTGAGFKFDDPQVGLRGIEAKDIPVFMILLKLSREVNKHIDDNPVDISGYAQTLKLVHERIDEINLQNKSGTC